MDEICFLEKPGGGGNIGVVILNRPQALNALTITMCKAFLRQLQQWARDPDIKAVIIKSASEKAFCAGGDVRSLYKNRSEIKASLDFFQTEYALNSEIYHFPKPYIAFLDGITMGGGAGISLHGSHRVATEKFSFAMPETAIGFFPDVGAGHFLTRCPGKTGCYLGLTGQKIKAAEALPWGLITHITTSQQLQKIEQDLLHTDFLATDFQKVTEILQQHTAPSQPSQLTPFQAIIDDCFSHHCVEDILRSLRSSNETFCQNTATVLSQRSPTSLKVTFEHLNRSSQFNFDHIMQMDLVVAKHFLSSHDFYEGVRAVLVDKDQSPRWSPATLEEVSRNLITLFFREHGDFTQ